MGSIECVLTCRPVGVNESCCFFSWQLYRSPRQWKNKTEVNQQSSHRAVQGVWHGGIKNLMHKFQTTAPHWQVYDTNSFFLFSVVKKKLLGIKRKPPGVSRLTGGSLSRSNSGASVQYTARSSGMQMTPFWFVVSHEQMRFCRGLMARRRLTLILHFVDFDVCISVGSIKN